MFLPIFSTFVKIYTPFLFGIIYYRLVNVNAVFIILVTFSSLFVETFIILVNMEVIMQDIFIKRLIELMEEQNLTRIRT